ncbi:MAG: RNA-binding S4 domain-containing protein [Clostridiales bacterium]|jgi:ribosome-associated protein|nr:RNA-binding S4 domain-containing protein [Clostridiales bacterium]
MDKIIINTEFIKLGQFLKLASIVSGGSEAKYFILGGNVSVNGETCLMRGKKVYPGDVIKAGGKEFVVGGG